MMTFFVCKMPPWILHSVEIMSLPSKIAIMAKFVSLASYDGNEGESPI